MDSTFTFTAKRDSKVGHAWQKGMATRDRNLPREYANISANIHKFWIFFSVLFSVALCKKNRQFFLYCTLAWIKEGRSEMVKFFVKFPVKFRVIMKQKISMKYLTWSYRCPVCRAHRRTCCRVRRRCRTGSGSGDWNSWWHTYQNTRQIWTCTTSIKWRTKFMKKGSDVYCMSVFLGLSKVILIET